MQPRPYSYQTGSSRYSHGRDRAISYTSTHLNDPQPESHGNSSRTTQPTRQPTSENHDYTFQNKLDSDSDSEYGFGSNHNPPYGDQRTYTPPQYQQYQQYQRYIEVPRQWTTRNPEIHRAVDHPALNTLPSSSTQPHHDRRSSNSQGRHSTTQSSQFSPPPPASGHIYPQIRRSGQSNNGHLTLSNLVEHEQRNTSASAMRRMLQEGQRAGPYDAIGYIRRDGRVFEYAYDANEEQNARNGTRN